MKTYLCVNSEWMFHSQRLEPVDKITGKNYETYRGKELRGSQAIYLFSAKLERET